MNKDYLINSVIERSQEMILAKYGITHREIAANNDNFLVTLEWDYGEDGDDILIERMFRWDYSNMELIQC